MKTEKGVYRSAFLGRLGSSIGEGFWFPVGGFFFCFFSLRRREGGFIVFEWVCCRCRCCCC